MANGSTTATALTEKTILRPAAYLITLPALSKFLLLRI